MLAVGPAHADAPRRIVSINLCADELLLQLADPGQIAALSPLAHDPRNSRLAGHAEAFPTTHGRAEEVVAIAPDLVLASTYTAPATTAMLRRLGLTVMALSVPHDFDGIARQMQEVANAIGRKARGEEAIRQLHEALRPPATVNAPVHGRALVLQANGIVAGGHTLNDSVLKAAGLTNIATEAGIEGYGRMPLEAIINARPDWLIIDAGTESGPALATRMLRHPALLALTRNGTRVIEMPPGLWVCAGPGAAAAVTFLRQAAQVAG